MALSRLANLQNDPTFSKIYVDPNNFDATDSIENRGTSPNRPFVSIQRAAIEAAMSSYVSGRNNDRNDRTTIVVSSGTHYIDNRPGFSIQNITNTAIFKKRTGKNTWVTSSLSPFDETTNFDIFDPANDLYKFNSINGGIILPRGTSIVGLDLRKTKIRPLYVPDPIDDGVERSSILNVTGSCYFSTFTFFDADTTKFSYKNYSDSKHVPKYSHHKLTTFVYADGVNKVRLGLEQTDLTDLEMYYYKISHAYNSLSGRNIPDYPQSLDFEPNINESRIVGALQENPLGISSIRAGNGDGTGDNSIITVTTANLQTKIEQPHNFSVDTPIIIKGITVDPNSYNGSFTVREVVGVNTFTFITPTIPQATPLPNPTTFDVATVSVESDTVSSASPYIFNCSLRSVYGMCGMWADGARADGFKSMVVAQFTGISLQKDDDAYLIYDDKIFYDDILLKQDPNKVNLRPLHQNSRAIFKPGFESFHIRASNDSFIQCVSIFAIGYAKHFITESGADMSITNSNSNFGAVALNSIGFRKISFDRDDVGYITHIIPPKDIDKSETNINWLPIDITKIKSVGDPNKLYLSNLTNESDPPEAKIETYKVGARLEDKLYLNFEKDGLSNVFSAPVCMSVPVGTSDIVSKKEYKVLRSGSSNEITNNILTFTENHKLFNGERIRIFSDSGQAPDGLEINRVYYAITTGVNANQIKIASTINDAIVDIPITGIENNGGIVTVVSTVTDKNPGDLGHPIQWDSTNNQWYLTVGTPNQIWDNRNEFLNPTPSTFIKRIEEERSLEDRLYKFRYVIPKEFENAKPPQVGFIIQESKNVAVTTASDETNPIQSAIELRNEKVIVDASVGAVTNNSQIVTIKTELPHNCIPGDIVKIQNVTSTNNPSGTGIVSTYNGDYEIISVPNSRKFTYRIEDVKINPGTFTNNINARTTNQQKRALPLVSRNAYKNNFYVYNIDTIQPHSPGDFGKDGIYHITLLSSAVSIDSTVGYGLSQTVLRQDVRNLYPQVDRDNAISNPNAATSYADLINVGRVITDDIRKSITLEATNTFNQNTRVGFGITNIIISGIGNTTLTIFTDVEHKLNSIKSYSVTSTGSNYPVNSTLYSKDLLDTNFDINDENATCKYSTNSSGQLIPTTFSIVDPGTAHTVGETLGVSGGTPNAIIQVTDINDNVGDGLELFNFQTTDINGIYEIISVPTRKSIVLHVPGGISTYTPNTSTKTPIGYLASKGVGITSVVLGNTQTGIVTVSTDYPHGLIDGNKFKFINSNLEFYNEKDFIVSSVVGINTFTFNVGVGIATTTQTPSTGKILKYGISSNAASLGTGEDNLQARGCFLYAGITTTTTSSLTTNSTTINLASSSGFKRGDFILVENEILRVSEVPIGNTISVLRNQLGTSKAIASSGSVVRKIKVLPVELRRPSYMRASGHTFEYLGFGPGNYSTALPQRQDRLLSEDEILVSQSKREQGGIVVYTGMNDLGEFYTGSKKSSALTNKETTIDAPIISFTGDDIDGTTDQQETGIFDDIIVRNRILVEGSGSQFYGSVEFKNKLTNHSDNGISVKNLFIRNRDASTQDKLFAVGISTPTSSSIINPVSGYTAFLSDPVEYIGHVFKDGSWRNWGLVSIEPTRTNVKVDSLGIGKSADSEYVLNVAGISSVNELYVNGLAQFNDNVTFGNATFSNLTITKTATFTGINTTYTQYHTQGYSRLFNLEVAGVSTFTGISTFNNLVDIDKLLVADNIRIGIADTNTIQSTNGNLRLKSDSAKVNVDSDLSVTSNEVSITTSRSSGLATAYITDSRLIRLGVGNTNQSSYIDLNNDSTIFPSYGLRIERASGIGSVASSLIHRGTGSFNINAVDNTDVKILTNNTERVRVGLSGTVTIYQDNSGQNLQGNHLKLTQDGPGDVALSWDVTHNNANRRWYAGIDTSDSYSWKLATAPISVVYGNENFDLDYKIKVTDTGTLTIFNKGSGSTSGKTLTINQEQLTSDQATYNLLNTTTSTINAFGNASTINLGANSGTLTLRNPTLVGVVTTQNLYNTVATTVNTFGAASTINLGANSGTLTLRNPTVVGTQATQNLYNTVATTVNAFGAASSINLGANSGTLTLRNPTVVGVVTTQNLYNTVATTVNAFGAASSINLGSNIGLLTINNSLKVSGISTLVGQVVVNTGIVPDADEDAYLGTLNLPFSKAYIEEIIIGDTNNTIDTANGDLNLNSASGIINISETTQSTDKDTGALVIDGGVGIEKTVNVGENVEAIGSITAGKGTGGVSLTANDGKGNANVTFNHRDGVPEQDGNAARIEVNTDGGTSVYMDFEVLSGVNNGISASLDRILRINETGITPGNNSLLDVGSTTNEWRYVYSNNFKASKLVDTPHTTTTTLNVSGISTLSGQVKVNTGIVPDTDEGAYLGTLTLPFSKAYIDEIIIGNVNNTIDTTTGNLILDSAGGTVKVDDNLNVSGIITGTTGVYVDNIRIGVDGNNEIDTTTGNLVLDSAGGTVNVTDKLNVTDVATIKNDLIVNASGKSFTIQNGAATPVDKFKVSTTTGDTTIAGKLSVSGIITGTTGVYVDNIRIGVGGNNEIDTTTGNLILDSAGGTVKVDDKLNVTGISTFNNSILAKKSLTVTESLTVDGTSTLATVDINSGNIDNTVIGGTTRAAASFTSIDVNTNSTFNNVIVDNIILRRYGERVSNLGNISGNRTINLNNGNIFTATITGNTNFTFSNVLNAASSGSSFTVILKNGANNLSVSWPNSVKFPNGANAPVRTLANGKTDIWIFITPDQGTTWYGSIALYNFA